MAPLAAQVLASPVNLNGTGHYLNFGFVSVSVANLVMFAVIGAAVVAALLLPFPGGGDGDD